jgi:hypothetical protein
MHPFFFSADCVRRSSGMPTSAMQGPFATCDKNGRQERQIVQARRRADSPPDDHSNADVESGAEGIWRCA